jgi:AbrB family transcriptional regulator (stage V sporulation protein T)
MPPFTDTSTIKRKLPVKINGGIFMKATGIVRRIDDLGRVVIPKEIRRTLRIRESDPLEIFTDREGEIILKKYSPIGELGSFAKEYAEALASASGHSVYITDRDQVIAAAGGIRKETVGTPVTGQLEAVMNEREHVLANQTSKTHVKITSEDMDDEMPQVISPILCEGDVIGSVILRSKDTSRKMGETEQVLAKCAAGFMGRQMEQ